MSPRVHLPLLRTADFQVAWYYSFLIFCVLLLVVWSTAVAARALPAMWRAGQRGLAVLVGSALAVTDALFASLLLTASIGLLRGSVG